MMSTQVHKLNVGCGRNIIEGWKNLDQVALDGVDNVTDIVQCQTTPIPMEDESVDEF